MEERVDGPALVPVFRDVDRETLPRKVEGDEQESPAEE
jgi:hypothetical protein